MQLHRRRGPTAGLRVGRRGTDIRAPAAGSPPNHWYITTCRRCYALYGGTEDDVLAQLGLNPKTAVGTIRHDEVERLARVCSRTPDAAWMEGLGPRVKILALAPLLRETALDLIATPDAYRL